MRFGLFALSAALLMTGGFAAQSALAIAVTAETLPSAKQSTQALAADARAYGSVPFSRSGREEAIILAMR
ncbi:hypothetical protein [Qipengyuania sp.]|uniref:hypothetical protein n=1 Tax=Qipengyuania sp. TaxID=2004515 RepID=UPI0035C83D4F